MSYIIWNNKKSSDITGLMICELPPITKPKIRTSTTEIDGRDGDIVELLGYKSYTKTISIGLTRNYDINEVINYFTGDGVLILSNEPDKYYKAQIIDNVDYEKLINFKKANIKFYCQPFKYLLNEPDFVKENSTEKSIKVSNKGYLDSKPIITVYGTGSVTISINNIETCTIDIDDSFLTIDSNQEECYKLTTLKNRKMLGNFPIFKSGINKVSWNGNVTKIIISPNSRWI